MQDWIAQLFDDKEMLRMGHHQRKEDLNLGLGWLYYSMVRIVRPETVVVIGSWRGFTPLVFARALMDNDEGGKVIFVDPSLADDFWKAGDSIDEYFESFGVTNVRHFLMTTQEFVETGEYRELTDIGIVFIDGYHTEEQARFDFEAFENLLAVDGIALFHDSKELRTSHVYGPEREYLCDVKHYMDVLKGRADLQVFDVPFGAGVTLVRKVLEQGTSAGEETPSVRLAGQKGNA